MTDPFPEARRRQRLDRDRHEPHSRRDSRRSPGPTGDQIDKALQKVEQHDVPGTPPVGALAVLRDAVGSNIHVGKRKLLSYSITEGRPRHGAYRSDDHVGRYKLVLPFHQLDRDVYAGHECPECGCTQAHYTYSATHFIAGHESVTCQQCEARIHSEEWG